MLIPLVYGHKTSIYCYYLGDSLRHDVIHCSFRPPKRRRIPSLTRPTRHAASPPRGDLYIQLCLYVFFPSQRTRRTCLWVTRRTSVCPPPLWLRRCPRRPQRALVTCSEWQVAAPFVVCVSKGQQDEKNDTEMHREAGI